MLPTPSSRFRDGIRVPLIRILRLYVGLITSLVMALTVLATYFYQSSQLDHEREQVLTRLTSEIGTQADELAALASSSLLSTGLTDSQGREVYLQPLLDRFNRNALRKFYVLDYRGRIFISPQGATAEYASAVAAAPGVTAAVRDAREGFGLLDQGQEVPQVLLVQRVLNPHSEHVVGFIVAVVDSSALLRQLDLTPGLAVSLGLGDLPLSPSPSGGWVFTAEGRGMAGTADFSVPVRVGIERPIYASLAYSLAGLLIALVLGLWTITRVKAWAENFARITTQRLDRLLIECQRILAGERPEAVEPGPDDELSQVTTALNEMLLKQKRFTDELRTTSLVFSTAAEGILVTDPAGRIVQANAAFLDMTGYTLSELIGQQSGGLYRSVVNSEGRQEMVDSLTRTGRWTGETTFLGRNGDLVPASAALSRILDENGRILGNVAVITDISRLKKIENQLRDLANQDALTGLPNFRHLSEQALVALETAGRESRQLAIVFMDLDNFKAVNDEYGHDVGDAAVRAIAQRFSKQMPPGHLLCRRSGDEFIAVLSRDAGNDQDLTQLLKDLTPLEVPAASGTVVVTATIGVSRFPEDGTDWHELQVRADIAMNAAKQERRGSLVWYDDAIGQKIYRRRQIQNRLREAIATAAFDVHYQPELDLRTGRVVGFEALARWHDSELGRVSPSEFIAAAEEARVMDAFTLCIAEKVLDDKPALQARFPGAVMAFNASPQVFRRSRLLEFLSERSARDASVLEGLEIELTETEIFRSDPSLQMQMQALVGLGVRLVIDDFGTGYSSLSRLTQFPISRLKIDRSFVEGLARRRETRIARLIVDLAKALGLDVTAEGVETVEQRDALVRMGCHRGQGWLFARAMPAADLLVVNPPVNFPGPVPAGDDSGLSQ